MLTVETIGRIRREHFIKGKTIREISRDLKVSRNTVRSGLVRHQAVPLSQLIDLVNERFGTDFNQADQLFFDQIIEAAMTDPGLRQAAAVNPGDKFELVFRNLLEKLFVERMDQNEEIFVRFMNDPAFQKVVTSWMASEAYHKLRDATSKLSLTREMIN